MRKLFYARLAASNIRKNGKFYFPYILTCICTVAMFYMLCAITAHPDMQQMPGAAATITIMVLGCIVVGIFAVVFLLYTNSFLMKRRKKELGLYNVLGMEKRHIGKMMFWETVYVSFGSLALGLATGILLSGLITMLLFRMLAYDLPFAFRISGVAIGCTVLLFFCIFVLTLLVNLARVSCAKPIELLHGGNVGEKEPKTKWVQAILGVLFLGAGYYIALVTVNPLAAIMLFFVAVVLVMAGTYLLFSAGSIALLKLLRKNKKFYYKTKHFTTVSGMLYRMKQNAVGLANICILSTMVLVMVSTTVCLYVGVDGVLDTRFPRDISVSKTVEPLTAGKEMEAMQQIINDKAASQGRTVTEMQTETVLQYTAYLQDGSLQTLTGNLYGDPAACIVCVVSAEEYQRITGIQLKLAEGQVAVYSNHTALPNSFTMFDKQYTVAQRVEPFLNKNMLNAYLMDSHCIVLPNAADLARVLAAQQEAYGNHSSSLRAEIAFNTDGTEAQEVALLNAITDQRTGQPMQITTVDANGNPQTLEIRIEYGESRAASKNDFYGLYGGFLFLGLFLGLLFTLATVLIIYYKQISEGYEDKERFEIMQKVGMSHAEVKKSIGSQMVLVFSLPLALTALHILASFKMITRLLLAFNLTDVALFAACSIGTLLVFTLVYGLVYLVAARSYYKIVETK